MPKNSRLVLILLAILFFLVILGLNFSNLNRKETLKETNREDNESSFIDETPSTETAVFCYEEQRGAEVCFEIYQPVCGNNNQTYSNSCFACRNEAVAYYFEGECS